MTRMVDLSMINIAQQARITDAQTKMDMQNLSCHAVSRWALLPMLTEVGKV